VNITVWPSGADLATKSAAMMPLAPGLASTMIGWPQRACSLSPIGAGQGVDGAAGGAEGHDADGLAGEGRGLLRVQRAGTQRRQGGDGGAAVDHGVCLLSLMKRKPIIGRRPRRRQFQTLDMRYDRA
jgi:hypothetical protein